MRRAVRRRQHSPHAGIVAARHRRKRRQRRSQIDDPADIADDIVDHDDGTVAGPDPDQPRRHATAAAMRADAGIVTTPAPTRSEAELRTDLERPRNTRGAVAVILLDRVGARSGAPSRIVAVDRVEQVEGSETDLQPAAPRQVERLRDAGIDTAVADDFTRPEHTAEVAVAASVLRLVGREDDLAERRTRAERAGQRHLRIPRTTCDAGADEAPLFDARDIVHAIGTEARCVVQLVTLQFLRHVRTCALQRQRRGEAPPRPGHERLFRSEVDRGVIGLAVVRADVQLARIARQLARLWEAVFDPLVALRGVQAVGQAVAAHEFEDVVAADVAERHRRLDPAEALAHAEVELIRIGQLGIVVEQPDVTTQTRSGHRRAQAIDRLQRRIVGEIVVRQHAAVGCARLRTGRLAGAIAEIHRRRRLVDRLYRLDARRDEQRTVVIAAGTGKQDRVAIAVHVVRYAEARLERLPVGLTVVAGRDIVLGVDPRGLPALIVTQRSRDTRGGHEVLVLGVAFIVPADTGIDRPMLVGRPIVLQEQAHLRVVRGRGAHRHRRHRTRKRSRCIEGAVGRRGKEESAVAARILSPAVFVEGYANAALHDVLFTEESDVVLDRPALLIVGLLERRSAKRRLRIGRRADTNRPGCRPLRQNDFRPRANARSAVENLLIRAGKLVQEPIAAAAVLRHRRSAKVRQIAFATQERAGVDRVLVAREQGQLTEIQALLEALRISPVELARDRLWHVGYNGAVVEGTRGLQVNRRRRQLLVRRLERAVEVQHVLDDRTAQIAAILLAIVIRLRAALAVVRLAGPIEIRNADERLGLPFAEDVAVEAGAAGFRHRADDRGAGLFVFRLEVLRIDAEFLHGQLREGIAAAEVLAGDTAVVDGILLAEAVDEDVDVVGADRTGLHLAAARRVRDRDARRERGEVQEVAIVLRQAVDLLRRHVG
ncbi:hypothetical protein WR25_22928 [Diploscapter pachys]|uniref:Uncharacterized protein n=1 Tax=Diploscapter pachys TaxID=2018661 RepID=A0A2A2JYS9_9BILA|nr:hypothetical protein WR25_22928 [Diploscapter pachys]